MAMARKTTTTKVWLEMDEREAITLAAILRHVGGDPTRSPREDAHAISMALSSAGFGGHERRVVTRDELIAQDGAIYFRNYHSNVG